MLKKGENLDNAGNHQEMNSWNKSKWFWKGVELAIGY